MIIYIYPCWVSGVEPTLQIYADLEKKATVGTEEKEEDYSSKEDGLHIGPVIQLQLHLCPFLPLYNVPRGSGGTLYTYTVIPSSNVTLNVLLLPPFRFPGIDLEIFISIPNGNESEIYKYISVVEWWMAVSSWCLSAHVRDRWSPFYVCVCCSREAKLKIVFSLSGFFGCGVRCYQIVLTQILSPSLMCYGINAVYEYDLIITIMMRRYYPPRHGVTTGRVTGLSPTHLCV
eukprot:gene11809-8120_t